MAMKKCWRFSLIFGYRKFSRFNVVISGCVATWDCSWFSWALSTGSKSYIVEKKMKSDFGVASSLCFIFVYCGIVMSKSLDPMVTIPALGRVRGSRMSSFNGREFLSFRGIPYAQPPVGELRFKVRQLFYDLNNFF